LVLAVVFTTTKWDLKIVFKVRLLTNVQEGNNEEYLEPLLFPPSTTLLCEDNPLVRDVATVSEGHRGL
jgi:hypothetical protein